MITKLHKIPDRTIFRIIFAFLILWNIKYFFLIFQIPYTMLFVDYIKQNAFYTQVFDIRQALGSVEDLKNETQIGFVSDTPEASVFDIQDSIRDFYLAQYAIAPVVLKNDTDKNYVIGTYQRTPSVPKGFKTVKTINAKTYLYKRINK